MRLILIGGAQRSGTTLLQTLLVHALGKTPLLPEAHILFDLIAAHQRAKFDKAKTSRYYEDEADLADLFRLAVRKHIDDLAARYGRSEILVLKNPNLARVVVEAKELLPDVQCIICLRDPRDIVASFLKIGRRQAERGMKTHYTRRNLDFICAKISASYKFISKEPVLPDVSPVYYEQLVTRPKDTLRRLALQADLPLHLERLDEARWLDDSARHQETWITELERHPPNPSSVGCFRSLLNDEELAKVEQVCDELMRRFSYEPASAPRRRKTGQVE